MDCGSRERGDVPSYGVGGWCRVARAERRAANADDREKRAPISDSSRRPQACRAPPCNRRCALLCSCPPSLLHTSSPPPTSALLSFLLPPLSSLLSPPSSSPPSSLLPSSFIPPLSSLLSPPSSSSSSSALRVFLS
uniref:Uncharacterized protein n=1 Tax=Knipowitschia caucasica TaxID=637954 RepID=A0AAV2J035_KNICA